jgi:hypothetical protein
VAPIIARTDPRDEPVDDEKDETGDDEKKAAPAKMRVAGPLAAMLVLAGVRPRSLSPPRADGGLSRGRRPVFAFAEL